MKVLITGAGGFLGSEIARQLLAAGHTVRGLGRRDAPALAGLGVDFVRGDVADGAAVAAAARTCDAIVHCASRIGSWGRRADFERTNVGGTEAVLAACRSEGVRFLVYTSSPSVAHGGGDVEGIDESVPPPPSYDAHYPRTKAIAEAMVRAAHGQDLATVAIRPHLIFGPGDTQLLPRALERARAGRLRLPGGPDKLIDCTYVDNAARAHVLALGRLAEGGASAACGGRAYFISQGEPLPIRQLIARVLAAAGVAPVTRTVPPWLMLAVGAAAELTYAALGIWDREPPMTRFVARQLSTAHWFDLSAARRDLGYRADVSLDEGLRRLAASMARPA